MGRVTGRRKGGFSSSNVKYCIVLSLVIVVFWKRCWAISASLNNTNYGQVSRLRLARIQRHLDKINKLPVFTIQSPDGDIIDCVHKRKQPALDHPLLKDHKIQRVQPELPKAMKEVIRNTTRSVDGLKAMWQNWHEQGTVCPEGTVPIRRITVHDVLRAKSMYDFGKKRTRFTALADRRPTDDDPNDFTRNDHEVSPELYGDNAPRLFTYWTTDGYRSTGCYNLLCPGFVQINSRIAIGAAISPVSTIDGNQYDITLLIWKDPKTGDWWLCFGNNTVVGYWPSTLFTHLSDRATMVEWGGEVVNSGLNRQHTTTQMGSGHFAQDGFGKASYFRNIQIVKSGNHLGSAQDIKTMAEFSNCYNIQSSSNDEWGTYFYYGGPGRNPQCP